MRLVPLSAYYELRRMLVMCTLHTLCGTLPSMCSLHLNHLFKPTLPTKRKSHHDLLWSQHEAITACDSRSTALNTKHRYHTRLADRCCTVCVYSHFNYMALAFTLRLLSSFFFSPSNSRPFFHRGSAIHSHTIFISCSFCVQCA